MRILPSARSLLVLFVASACVFAPALSFGETLRVGGTGGALGTMKMLAGPFMAANPGVTVEVLPSLGSGGGVRALLKGAIDVAVVVGPLKEADRRKGLEAADLGITPVVFLTSRRGRETAVTLTEAADMLSGRRPTWPDGVPVRAVLRPRGETDILWLRAFAAPLNMALDAAFARPELPIASTDQDTLDMLESLEGSFGFSSLAAVVSEKRNLTVLALDGVAPTLDAVAGGAYRLLRLFQLVLRPDAGARARAFVAFAKSADGQRILRDAGTLPKGGP